jgi:APA family basic amino acid/polyamine antiporter
MNMVIANMIGTGIFTAIGFQVMDTGIPDAFSIIIIWVLGGVFSLCGAFAYTEVASTINRSGGEYSFLSKLYHPIWGFLSGWISLIVGFSAAIAALALATSTYFLPLIGLSNEYTVSLFTMEISIQKVMGIAIILVISLVHIKGVKFGGIFQNYITAFKLALIGAIIIIPFLIGSYEPANITFAPTATSADTIFSFSFAGSLVWVMFAYSGWNASSYIIGDLDNPKRNLPYSLITGTIVVAIIYVLLNLVFMYVATFDELAGQIDVGNIVMQKVFGNYIGIVFSGFFSIALMSGISAMVIAGPRVAEQMGKDYSLFKRLSAISKSGTPTTAILFLAFISCILVLISSFKDMVEYIGLTLTIFSLMTVAGVFIIRKKGMVNELGVRCWGYPFTPLIFIALSIWMISYFIYLDPMKICWSLLTMLPGIILFLLLKNETSAAKH